MGRGRATTTRPTQADRWTDDGWFKTGDIVTIDPRGFIQIQDRSKDVIKSGGEWITSVALENALMAHPAVAEAAVIAVPHEKWDERPLAAVVLREGATATARRAARVPRAAVREVVAARRLRVRRRDPEDGVGKFRKTALREQFAGVPASSSAPRSSPAPPRGSAARVVERLERDGWDVTALDLRDGFDVGDPQAWESVGPVDLACLNAGVSTGADGLAEVSDEAYARIRGANLDGVVYGTRRLARVMEPGSAIVATASLAGLVAMELDPLYTATKHAVVGFVRAAAPQLAERGIRISAVAPGFADTPILDGELRAGLESGGFPLLTAEEVAAAILAAAGRRAGGRLGRPAGPRAAAVPLPERARPAHVRRRQCLALLRVRSSRLQVSDASRPAAPFLAARQLGERPAVAGGERLEDAPGDDHPVHLVRAVVDAAAAGRAVHRAPAACRR